MIGVDTNILVAHAIEEHPSCERVRERLDHFLAGGERLAITSGIIAEFIHIVTDPKRFGKPLPIADALQWAEFWSGAGEVVLIHGKDDSHSLWLEWQAKHLLGRKRLLDTVIAATWHSAGVREVFTLNPRDFEIFRAFQIHSVD